MKTYFFIFIPFFMISFSPGEGMNDTLSQQEESETTFTSLSRKDAIQLAQEYLYFNDNKFKEMIEVLEPLLSSDGSSS